MKITYSGVMSTLAVGLVIAGGGGVAYAANGGAFALGASNYESRTASLSNSAGTPLSLKAPAGKAPLAVNRTTRVTNLNSDLVDGKSASSFALATGRTGTIFGEGQAGFAEAACPAGTIMTGGGGADMTETGVLWSSYPATATSWAVDGSGGGYTVAFAQCYNPKGAVPGAASAASVRQLQQQMQQQAARR